MYWACFTQRSAITLRTGIKGYPSDYIEFLGTLGQSKLNLAILYSFLKVDSVKKSSFYFSSEPSIRIMYNFNLLLKTIAIKSNIEKSIFA